MYRVLIVSLILVGQCLGAASVSAAPITIITSPANGASISSPNAFTFSATASDPSGIAWVRFYIQSYGTGPKAPKPLA
ncbi:MAG: Ig-like domain-containing protein [bacterium]|nr:Ig-like domain-containing protein [bacterium]